MFDLNEVFDEVIATVAMMYVKDRESIDILCSKKEFSFNYVLFQAVQNFSYLIDDDLDDVSEISEFLGVKPNIDQDRIFEVIRETDSKFAMAYEKLIHNVEKQFIPENRGTETIFSMATKEGGKQLQMDLIHDASMILSMLKNCDVETSVVCVGNRKVSLYGLGKTNWTKEKVLIDYLAKIEIDIFKFISSLNRRKEFLEYRYKYTYLEDFKICGNYLADQNIYYDTSFWEVCWSEGDDGDD